ncbi:hypothetical protein AOLI_G00090940 [Acnodon oligacanthus]
MRLSLGHTHLVCLIRPHPTWECVHQECVAVKSPRCVCCLFKSGGRGCAYKAPPQTHLSLRPVELHSVDQMVGSKVDGKGHQVILSPPGCICFTLSPTHNT